MLVNFGEALISNFDSVTHLSHICGSVNACVLMDTGELLIGCVVVIDQGSVNYGLQATSSRDHMCPTPPPKQKYLLSGPF